MEKFQNWFENALKQAGLDSFSCLELQLLWVLPSGAGAGAGGTCGTPGSPISMSQGRWLPTEEGESGRGIFLA